MQKYFNLFLEFDRNLSDNIIKDAIHARKKGYVCVVDGNVLSTSYRNEQYKEIVNGALVNLCDGSSIALIAGIIHRQHFSTYTGPELFTSYVKKKYKQYFLGNTVENLDRLKIRFSEFGYDITRFKFETLPFKVVEEFDYLKIAKQINEFSPDIIWISLGAPKQELFISKLYPYINKGILIAIGAAFNLYLADKTNKRAPKILRKLKMEWLFRIIQEPKRVGHRALKYFVLLPRLVTDEIKQIKNSRHNSL